MKRLLWSFYLAIMFTAIEVMAVLFWYLALSVDRSVVIMEPSNWIFTIELVLLSAAAIGTLILSLLWMVGYLHIDLRLRAEDLTPSQVALIEETNAALKDCVQEVEGAQQKK